MAPKDSFEAQSSLIAFRNDFAAVHCAQHLPQRLRDIVGDKPQRRIGKDYVYASRVSASRSLMCVGADLARRILGTSWARNTVGRYIPDASIRRVDRHVLGA